MSGSHCLGAILGKYEMDMTDDGFMGEGSFCTCRRARCLKTGRDVAIKFFKLGKQSSDLADASPTLLRKFRRQINVMKALANPLTKPESERFWTESLAKTNPANIFVQLIDYSQDANGCPSTDADGGLYVATELGQCSLQDFLHSRKRKREALSKQTISSLTKAILLITAGLHAHGYVHLDLKPENLMLFDGWLKLIDLDGCVKIGDKIEIDDPTISFSPCYCAPEWARWLLETGPSPSIIAKPSLDVWSVGCTVCELFTLEAMMKRRFTNFLHQSASHREAGILYLEWLGSIKRSQIPDTMRDEDEAFARFLEETLLVCNVKERWTCAECLGHPYILDGPSGHRISSPLLHLPDEIQSNEGSIELDAEKQRKVRGDARANMHAGLLWKLNLGKDASDKTEWLQNDMWIANNMSLCYYSLKEQKRLVLLDAHKLYGAEISHLEGVARPYAFKIVVKDEDATEDMIFAGASAKDTSEWIFQLKTAANMDTIPTVHLGPVAARDLEAYKVTVKNRRIKVTEVKNDVSLGPFDALFKSVLWKVKAGGNRMREADWFKRECWLARNYSLVYYSEKEKCELIYYTRLDIFRADFKKISNESSLKPWAFQIRLPPADGVEFAPGEFAAESEELREKWLEMFSRAREGASERCPEYSTGCIRSTLQSYCDCHFLPGR